MKAKSISIFIILFVVLSFSQTVAQSTPRFEKHGDAFHLIVNEKPFLILGGELGNSNASTPEYLNTIWPKLVKMNLNTVLIPVYWELIEPVEGKYDFALIDYAITSARKYNLKIVFLWFGSWKNSMSCYIPSWMKVNQNKYPRSKSRQGISQEILTPFNENNLQADLNVYKAMMKHIKGVDHKEQTVIMMQVENEIGMLPDARDYSD